MKTGKTIEQVSKELNLIRNNKKDYVLPTGAIQALPCEDGIKLECAISGGSDEFKLTEHSHGQLASYAGVPRKYYEKLKDQNPELLAECANHGIQMMAQAERKDGRENTRMVRTIGDTCRGLLSGNYKRIDCFRLFEEIMPTIEKSGMVVKSSNIDDESMVLKVISPKTEQEVNKGDIVQYGLTISNSDVGAGLLKIEPLIYRLVCTNGMISATSIGKFERPHFGSYLYNPSNPVLADDVDTDKDVAFWDNIRDVTNSAMDSENFTKLVERFRAISGNDIKDTDLEAVIERTTNYLKITNADVKVAMLEYLEKGADGAGLNQYGLVNSITWAAQVDSVNYKLSTNLERAAEQLMFVRSKVWDAISQPAA